MLCLPLPLLFIGDGRSSSAVLSSGAESDHTGIESGGGGGIDGEAKAAAPYWLQRARQNMKRNWISIMGWGICGSNAAAQECMERCAKFKQVRRNRKSSQSSGLRSRVKNERCACVP